VRDKIPVCPTGDPAPADPAAEQHQHEPTAPGAPQDAPALAQEAAGAVQGAADDPASAPGRIAGLVATIVQFVKDLLHLPVAGAAAVGDGLSKIGDAAQAAGHAVADAASTAKGAIARSIEAVGALFHHDAVAPTGGAGPKTPRLPALDARKSLLAPVQRLVSA
jgi:hypothetical protein